MMFRLVLLQGIDQGSVEGRTASSSLDEVVCPLVSRKMGPGKEGGRLMIPYVTLRAGGRRVLVVLCPRQSRIIRGDD